MYKKVSIALAALFWALSPTFSQAGDRSLQEVYTECGIGGLIFGNMSGSAQYLAIISNVTWDLGTTAIISDASSPETCNQNAKAVALLINTYPTIENELALGQGEHLDAVIASMNCSANPQDIVANVRADFGKAVNGADFDQLDRLGKSSIVYDSLLNNCTV